MLCGLGPRAMCGHEALRSPIFSHAGITSDAATLGPPRVLAPASSQSASTLSSLEKNWSPFSIGQQVFVHQWLDDPRGRTIVHQVDITTGHLTETFVGSEGADLRRTIGARPHAIVSGGTPAVMLDSSLCPKQKPCLLAIGHTMTSPCNDVTLRAKVLADQEQTKPAMRAWYAQLFPNASAESKDACFWHHRGFRAYAAFAYLFRASPPFTMLAATKEFHITPGNGLQRFAPVATECGYGPCNGMVQFPVGLSFDKERRSLLLSWGLHDRLTMLSTLPVNALLNITRPVHHRHKSHSSLASPNDPKPNRRDQR